MSETKVQNGARRKFIQIAGEFLLALKEMFPDCQGTEKAEQKFNTFVAGSESIQKILIKQWFTDVTEKYKDACDQRNVETILTLPVPLIQEVKIAEKWNAEGFTRESQITFFAYVDYLNDFAKLYRFPNNKQDIKDERARAKQTYTLPDDKITIDTSNIPQVSAAPFSISQMKELMTDANSPLSAFVPENIRDQLINLMEKVPSGAEENINNIGADLMGAVMSGGLDTLDIDGLGEKLTSNMSENEIKEFTESISEFGESLKENPEIQGLLQQFTSGETDPMKLLRQLGEGGDLSNLLGSFTGQPGVNSMEMLNSIDPNMLQEALSNPQLKTMLGEAMQNPMVANILGENAPDIDSALDQFKGALQDGNLQEMMTGVMQGAVSDGSVQEAFKSLQNQIKKQE